MAAPAVDDHALAGTPGDAANGAGEEAGAPEPRREFISRFPGVSILSSSIGPANAWLLGDGFWKTGFDATSVLRGKLELEAAPPDVDEPSNAMAGRHPAKATVAGAGRNAYARAQWQVNWEPGTIFSTGADFFLPEDFYRHQTGAVHLLGWDTWPVAGNQMRLQIWHTDHQARLFLKRAGRDFVLTNAFRIPEGRWVRITVEQKISDTDGWSKVYLDGQLVAQGSGRTAAVPTVTRMRYGLVGIDAGRQQQPLVVYFDQVHLHVHHH